jgi:hypothetical protein
MKPLMQLTRINSWEDLRAEFSRLFTHPHLGELADTFKDYIDQDIHDGALVNCWYDLKDEPGFTLLDLGDYIEYAVSLLCNYNNDWMNFAPGGAPPMLDHVSVLKMVAEVAGINWSYQDMNGEE